MQLSHTSRSAIQETVFEALAHFNRGESPALSDLHLQPEQETGRLYVYDDDDRLLAKATVSEWAEVDEENFWGEVETLLVSVLQELPAERLERVNLLKPYSFTLIDAEKETVAELRLVDDDTLLVNNELLKGLDEELDDFLKQLLAK